MVTLTQAQERADSWVNGGVPPYERRTVRVTEFGLGYVAWAEDREDGPTSDGGAVRMVISRDDGRVTLWPGLPADEVIRRYEEAYGGSPAAAPEPARPPRLDLEATSFLLSPPHKAATRASHAGEELLFVVNGRIAIKLDGEELVLGKGDCLYFSGETPHEVRSLGRQKAEVLVVVAQSPV